MKITLKTLAFFLAATIFLCVPASSFALDEEYVGREVTLKPFEDSGIIYAGVDKQSFQAATGNLMGKDKEKYLINRLSNAVFEIRPGTHAVVLDVDFWAQAAKVEIREGTFKGQTCWVLMEQALGY
ncbi:MAG: hypothetical protein ABH865_06965 [Candidatus Omnitrophota bacterium]|nr:hypothetical protein [Candidatus Omnitrophota bacterium]